MEVAFISGGSEGIGLETVKYFQRNNFKVITCGRSPERWERSVKADINLSEVDFYEADLSDQANISKLFDKIKANYGSLKVAINNASPDIKSGGVFLDQQDTDLIHTISSDLISHMLCMKYELKLMKSGSCIVNVSSVNGIRPTPNASAYSAAKHGLEGLTKSVALEAIETGIRVNSVAPGVTWTPRWERRKMNAPDIKEEVCKVIPIGRFAEAKEIAKAIAWLCSPDANYIVGHTLVVDGGLSLK